MNRIVQPSVAKRITFATWARKEGLNRHSSATWTVPGGLDIPADLLAGAQIDGKPYDPDKPKRTRTRVRKQMGPVSEPAPLIDVADTAAKGDGATDDTAAIQAAIDEVKPADPEQTQEE